MDKGDRFELFWPFLRRYRLRLAALGLLMLGATSTEGLGVGLFYPLVEYIQQGGAFLTQGNSRVVFERLAQWGVRPSIGLFIFAIFCVILMTLALKWAILVASARVYNPLMKDIRDAAFANILRSHLFCFHAGSSATLNQTLEDEVENVGQSLNFLVLVAGSALALAVYIALLVAMSWRLTLLVGGIAAVRYAVSGLLIRKMRALGEQHWGLRVRHKSVLTAIHQGIDVVKSFATESWEDDRYRALTSRILANSDANIRVLAANAFVEGLLGDGLLCVVVYLAVSRLAVSGAALLTFLFIITRIIPKVTAINDARIRVAEYLSRVRVLPGALEPGGLPVLRWGAVPKPRFEDRIVFEKVGFSYPAADFPSLSGINLTLARGETLALVGESGAGKSTLARLLLRLFDPTSGRISVDGIALPELRREDWARLIGVVAQDTFIFDDTLENNVRYGSPERPREAFVDALRRARALEFVERLPEREGTRLGERGVKLSGGQRQRVAIARAFLRNSPILILDEATSAMDAATEKLIQDAIEELAKDRTMLVIAHRFTTIRHADRIAVLDQGRVAEQGTHEELMASGRLYRRFHGLQSR